MTIEQKFFEKFGYKPKYTYDIKGINAFGGVFTETISSKDKFKKEAWRWKTKEYRYDRKVIKVNKHYPPITPEIVLGLEKLLGSFCCGTLAFRTAYWYKLPIQHIWWTENKKEEFLGNTRIEALLSLFIEYKDNIDQTEVRALFKC